MTDDYIAYWGLEKHPFLLAPDSGMMSITGQYYECLERLKYAIGTGKGGVLIVSEDAGLGKTTILLKFVEQMKEDYGGSLKCAFIDHPTLTADQMIAQITEAISGEPASEDKLRNLVTLKNHLIDTREHGGRSIIIVDEGQMLCGARDVLQELRVLINLTHNNEYLHTFVLSGQKALWDTIREMPEFWQRLPVRYYFVPLRLDETKELVRFRLKQAGLVDGKEIFSDDALEVIHRNSNGSPRTIIALSDLSLLVGSTNRATKITYKEVSRAVAAMAGKGDSLPYVNDERKMRAVSLGGITELRKAPSPLEGEKEETKKEPEHGGVWSSVSHYVRPPFAILALIFLVLLGGLVSYHLSRPAQPVPVVTAKKEAAIPPGPAKEITQPPSEKPSTPEAKPSPEPEPVKSPPVPAKEAAAPVTPKPVPAPEKQMPVSAKETVQAQKPASPPAKQAVVETKPVVPEKSALPDKKPKPERTAVITAGDAANVRLRPDVKAPRIGVIMRGEKLKVTGEKTDREGQKWYRVLLYSDREGWISGTTATIR